MISGRKQFAVYRLKRGKMQTEALRHRTWNYLQHMQVRVTSENYEQICVSAYELELEAADLRRQLENGLPAPSGAVLEVSDVLVITKDGITNAFYVDLEKLILLAGFFHQTSSTALLTVDTTDFQIEGRSGNWLAADEKWIDGRQFFLMQSQQFGNKAAYAVLDSQGHVAAEDTAVGFTDEIVRQIREYIRSQEAVKQARETVAPPLENWQKSYENGEYLRSAEMAEEQNYSMIDGRMNNMPPKVPHQDPATKSREHRRKKGKRPLKSRESVLKRLRAYQEELAGQRGKEAMSQETPDLQERRKG